MSKIVYEQILGELLREGKTIYAVKLEVTVKELWVNERTMPADRAVAQIALSPMSTLKVEDGDYILRYSFEGKQHEQPVRVQNGVLLSCVAA